MADCPVFQKYNADYDLSAKEGADTLAPTGGETAACIGEITSACGEGDGGTKKKTVNGLFFSFHIPCRTEKNKREVKG